MVARNPFRRISSDRGVGGRQVRGGGSKKNQSARISSDGEGVGSGCWETFFAFTRTAKPVIIGLISITKKRRKIHVYLCTHALLLSLGLALGSSCHCCLRWRQQLLLLLLLLLASASALALVAAGVGQTAIDVHGVVGWCPSTQDVGVVVIMMWPICHTSVTKCDMSAEKLLQLNCTPAYSCRSEQVQTRFDPQVQSTEAWTSDL